MASAIEVFRYMGSVGQIKLEFILLDSPNSGDTSQTRLSRPVGIGVLTGQTTGQIINPSASLNGKAITIGTNDGIADLMLLVVGF